MKTLSIFAICAIVCLELCSTAQAQKFRTRREAVKVEKLNPKMLELYQQTLKEMVTLQKNTLNGYKTLMEKVVAQAKKADLKSDDLDTKIEEYQELLDRANQWHESQSKDDNSTDELIDIVSDFGYAVDFELTKEEKLLQRIMDDNGLENFNFNYFKDFILFNDVLKKRLGEYIAKLTDAEKQQETKLIDLYKKLQNGKSIDDYFQDSLEFLKLFESESE